MRITCPTCGKFRTWFNSVLVQIRRCSLRPWPLSYVSYSGGESLQLEAFDILTQRGLIVFDYKQVVSLLVVYNVFGDLLLREHRVAGDHRAPEVTAVLTEALRS